MTKAWLDIKTQFNLSNKQHYFWIQLINAIPKSWKEELRRSNHILDALSVYDHHLIRKNQIYSLDKCNSKLMAYSVCFFVFFMLFFFVLLGFLGVFFSFIMALCKYYFEILFYVTFVFIKEKKSINNFKKCNSKELYCLQVSLNNSKTRSQLYFEDLFQIKDIDWKHLYLLPHLLTMDTNLSIQIFQYKILNTVKPVLTTTLKQPPVLNDHVVVLP